MNHQEALTRAINALARHGLRMSVSDLSESTYVRQKKILDRLVTEHGGDAVVRAIRYGMPNVWPFNEGRAFDARDLANNILKAIGEANVRARAGEVPQRIVVQEADGSPEA